MLKSASELILIIYREVNLEFFATISQLLYHTKSMLFNQLHFLMLPTFNLISLLFQFILLLFIPFSSLLSYPIGDEFGPIAVYPLYSSLPPRQQQDIFKEAPSPRQPGGPPGRKIVNRKYDKRKGNSNRNTIKAENRTLRVSQCNSEWTALIRLIISAVLMTKIFIPESYQLSLIVTMWCTSNY